MRNFKNFWISQSLSLIGNEITTFAIPIWLYQKYGKVSSVTIGFAIIYASKVIAGPFSGFLVDKFSRKSVLIKAEFFQMLATSLLLVFIHLDYQSLFLIYSFLALSSLINTARFPAMMASIPQLVPKKDLLKSNGLISMTDSIAVLSGPLLGGAVMSFMNIKGVLLIDIFTFIAAILILNFIRFPVTNKSTNILIFSFRKLFLNFIDDFKNTISLIKKTQHAVLLLCTSLIMNFFIIGVYVLITPMLLYNQHSVKVISLIVSSIGIAQIISGYIVTKMKINNLIFAIYTGITFMGIFGYLLIAFSSNLIALGTGMFLLFGCLPLLNSFNRSTFQNIIPNEHHGRFFSARRSISQSLTPLSALFSGYLMDTLSSENFIGDKFQLLFLSYGILIVMIGILGMYWSRNYKNNRF